MALRARQAAFVREYLVDLNATQAAIRAGYSQKTAEQIGYRLLRERRVKDAIGEALRQRAERVEVKADDVLRELISVARVDIAQAYDAEGRLLPFRDMPEEVRRAIGGVEVEELYEGRGEEREHIGHVRKVKFWPKVQALELLGKHLKLFTDKVEHSADASFAELLKGARARAAQSE